jgi:hypothetical protein
VIEPVRKHVRVIRPDPLKNVTVVKHDLGQHVIAQLHGAEGRVLDVRIDVLAGSVAVYFGSGVTEQLTFILIG